MSEKKAKLTLVLLLVAVIAAGCTNSPSNEPAEASASPSAQPPAYKETVTPSYKPLRLEPLDEEKAMNQLVKARSIRYYPLEGQREAVVHLHVDSASEDPYRSGEVYAYLEQGDKQYGIGVVGAYGLDDVELSLADRTGDGVKELQFIGSMGASYRELKLVGYIEEEGGYWAKLLSMGSPLVADLDGDGTEELAAVSMGSLPAYVDLYRWHEGQFETAGLTEQLGADYVSLAFNQDEAVQAWVFEGGFAEDDEQPVKHYRYESGALIETVMK